jgi:hypothetical protein
MVWLPCSNNMSSIGAYRRVADSHPFLLSALPIAVSLLSLLEDSRSLGHPAQCPLRIHHTSTK